ncbi:MAG: class I SAM-dependent methyltransferase [Patescibacteria group bacterium]|nr:class I SAM-dependent methyltransferase [Patescibacteria group bacterium]
MQTQKYSWKSLAEVWKDLKPPMRPSRGEIKIYERFLKQIIKKLGKKPKVLLFGATPELRDLFAKYNLSVTMVDINPEMVSAMDKLTTRQNPKEKKVWGDWLEFRVKEKFDLACGDHLFCNIPFSKYNAFFENIIRHLNPDGYFVINVVLREIKEKIDFPKFLVKYRKDKKLRQDKEEKWYWLYALMFNSDLYHKKDYGHYWLSINELLNQARARNIETSAEEVGAIADYIFFPRRYLYIVPPRKIFEKALKKYFKIIDSDINKKHPVYKCYRIYFARKNL